MPKQGALKEDRHNGNCNSLLHGYTEDEAQPSTNEPEDRDYEYSKPQELSTGLAEIAQLGAQPIRQKLAAGNAKALINLSRPRYEQALVALNC